jgi:hypothetical protein
MFEVSENCISYKIVITGGLFISKKAKLPVVEEMFS